LELEKRRTGRQHIGEFRGAVDRIVCLDRLRVAEPQDRSGAQEAALGSTELRAGPTPRSWERASLVVARTALLTPLGRVQTVDLASVVGLQSARLAIFTLNGLVHLLAVHRDFNRGRDPQSNLIATYVDHGDDDVISDDDTFIAVTRQDQHC
jgi:hypothetical protein